MLNNIENPKELVFENLENTNWNGAAYIPLAIREMMSSQVMKSLENSTVLS